MALPRFLITVKTTNLRVELRVNDIPVVSLLPGEAEMPAEVPVNEFLVAGRNAITAILHAGPVPSQVLMRWVPDQQTGPYTGPANMALQIARYPEDHNTVRHHPPELMRLDWNGSATPVPLSTEKDLTVAEAAFPWAWISAEKFPRLDATTWRSAFDLLQHLHTLLAERRFAEFITTMDLKFDEVGRRAYGVSPVPMRATLTGLLEKYDADPAWTLLPLDPETVDLRLVAGGRMIECLRKDGHRALQYQQREGGSTFFLPAMLGSLNSVWQVLR